MRLGANPGDEGRIVIQAIPRPHVHVSQHGGDGIRDPPHHRVAGSDDLHPVDALHLARGIDEKWEHPALFRRERHGIGVQANSGVARQPIRRRGGRGGGRSARRSWRGGLRGRGWPASRIPPGSGAVSEQAGRDGGGTNDCGDVREIDARHLVRDLVVVGVQVERRQRVGRNTGIRECDVVAPSEKALFRSRIPDNGEPRVGEHPAHRRALVPREPGSSWAARERIGAPDHLDLEIRRHARQWDGRMRDVPARAEQAEFFARRRDEDHGATRRRPGRHRLCNFEDGHGAGRIVIGPVEDRITPHRGAHPEVVVVRIDEYDRVPKHRIGATQPADDVDPRSALRRRQ